MKGEKAMHNMACVATEHEGRTMKKLFIFWVSMLFISGIFAGPVRAVKNVFVVRVIKCGATGSPDGCGSDPPATDPLRRGKVRVDAAGDVTVWLKGASPNTTYTVFVGNWVTGNGFQSQFDGEGPECGDGIAVGTVSTNDVGNFRGPITTASGNVFAFPPETTIGQPNFAFNNPPCGPTQFTTGFRIP
jgi:hypothetical protein